MSYQVNETELNAVMALSPPERYGYFINKATDWEEVWSLYGNEGWVLMADSDDHEVVPVWPAALFAQACCVDQWTDCQPKAIGLAEWLEKWIPGMSADHRTVAVFPLPDDHGVVISPHKLELDLAQALEAYE